MSDRQISVAATRYEVTVYPYDDINRSLLTIAVEYRGGGRWAVLRRGACLGRTGEWDYEPRPSSRDDDWLDDHRFDFDTALDLAKRHAPNMEINGVGVEQIIKNEDAGRG